MQPAEAQEITVLLRRWSDGDRAALEEVTPLVYRELRLLADGYLRRERPGHTLQATELVHEAYLRLVGQKQSFAGRKQFYGVAAHLMRIILVGPRTFSWSAKARQRRPERLDPVYGHARHDETR